MVVCLVGRVKAKCRHHEASEVDKMIDSSSNGWVREGCLEVRHRLVSSTPCSRDDQTSTASLVDSRNRRTRPKFPCSERRSPASPGVGIVEQRRHLHQPEEGLKEAEIDNASLPSTRDKQDLSFGHSCSRPRARQVSGRGQTKGVNKTDDPSPWPKALTERC